MLSLNGWSRIGSLLAGKNYKWLVIPVEVVLVLLLTRQLAVISWAVVSQYIVVTPEQSWSSVSAASNQENNKDTRYSNLESLQLFGRPLVAKAVSSKPQTNKLQEIPVSSLRARVTGLVAHPDESKALVVIDSGGRQKTYFIGDEIYKSSATIDAIYPDRVIINNRGKQEALLLYPNEKKIGSQQKQQIVSAQPTTSIKQLRAQVLANPASLAEMVSISPVRADGELKGYRINPKKYQQLFTQAGLKANDLATAINGYDLTDPAQAMEVLNTLKTLNQVALTVEREGQLYQIDLSL